MEVKTTGHSLNKDDLPVRGSPTARIPPALKSLNFIYVKLTNLLTAPLA
jgi:hypothetical protein